MRKIIRCIPSVQRIIEETSCNADVAVEVQEDRATTVIDEVVRNGWELESVSGSPEQGLVLVFKDTTG